MHVTQKILYYCDIWSPCVRERQRKKCQHRTLYIYFLYVTFMSGRLTLEWNAIGLFPLFPYYSLASDDLSFHDRPWAFLITQLLIQWSCGSESFYLIGLSISVVLERTDERERMMMEGAVYSPNTNTAICIYPQQQDQEQTGEANTLHFGATIAQYNKC